MSKVGFGIIGCGVIAPIHADAISRIPDAKLIAVSDVVEKNVKTMSEQYNAAPYSDYKEMIKRDDVHAVSLCVPSGMRLEIAEACAAAGKHILAEKPLEVNSDRIRKLIAAVDAAGVKLSCIFQYRYADGPMHIRRALDEGRFGKLVLGDAYIKWYRSQEYYDSGKWRGTRNLDGGGCLMNQGIHQIDMLLWFMGNAKSVTAQTALVGHTGIEVEDLACAMIQFENGAMGVIEGSTAIWPGHPARVEVHGTEGSAVIEDGELAMWKFREERPEDATILAGIDKGATLGSGASDPIKSLKSEGHRRQIADFVESLVSGRPPKIDGREGRKAVELIEAVYRSAETGKPVAM
ncbi:MAG: Gfo/Idh/MocA family oxidoreductase [Candidatus Hydrogenedentes bacterium]|nr:Gfo/Idh/MocA family oxidoreductase [Candidatus Hydrogenedentota bacterium]